MQADKVFKQIYIGFLIIVIGVGITSGTSAWAAEATIAPTVLSDKLRSWQVTYSEEDPYLAQATQNVPDYSYTEAGSVIANTHPITTAGDWSAKKKIETPDVVPVTIYAAAPVAPKNGDPIMILEGEASYYSRAGCLGCSPNLTMANGQPLDDNALTMAIGADMKHLVGRTAKVTNLVTNQSTHVLITDTGGFYAEKYGSRVADLTIATKQAIGMYGGVGQVRVEVF